MFRLMIYHEISCYRNERNLKASQSHLPITDTNGTLGLFLLPCARTIYSLDSTSSNSCTVVHHISI